MKQTKKVLVLFGGQSSEHDVSCISVQTILKAMDSEKWEPVIVGITKEGKWLLVEKAEEIADGSWKEKGTEAVLSPDATAKNLLVLKQEKTEKIKIDLAFPVLHGKYGEDGTIQGLFELAQIPYVGCGVLASAVSMDKVYTKQIVDVLGIRQASYVVIWKHELAEKEECIDRAERKLKYPVFVKPSKAGSSCGVNKAENREKLWEALKQAAEFDTKILIEETITGRELECAVFGGINPDASGVGEVIAAEEFYSYDAKYNNPESSTDLSPDLPKGKMEEIRKDAIAIFRAVDGFGLSRVDFFLEKQTNEVVFNEINTLPGFTSISMYPMLWEKRGVSKEKLVDQLLEMASQRE